MVIGINDRIGIFNPGITECLYCGTTLDEVIIENHQAGGWFIGLECAHCGERFNIRKLETIEEIRRARTKFNRACRNIFKEKKESKNDN